MACAGALSCDCSRRIGLIRTRTTEYGWHGFRTSVEVERAEGIEPSSVAWKATALPLCYARAFVPRI